MKKISVFGIVIVALVLSPMLISVCAFDLSVHRHFEDHSLKAIRSDQVNPYPWPYQEPYLTYEVSECLVCDTGGCEDMEFIIDGHDLTYIHYSEMIYNCCATMSIQMEIEGSTIRFLEVEHFGEDGACWCLCDYELTGTVHNLLPGEYTVEIWSYISDGEFTELICQTAVTI